MASPSCSPVLSCLVCMFNYTSAFFTDNGTCTKRSLFASLEARLSDLENTICTLQMKPMSSLASQPPLAGERRLIAEPTRPPAAPEQQRNQGNWVTVRRKHSPKQKPMSHHPPSRISNRFSPLSDTPTERPILVIGSSILQNVTISTSAAIVKCIPGARAGDMETNLKLQAKSKCKIR